jgi:hypothetical protein
MIDEREEETKKLNRKLFEREIKIREITRKLVSVLLLTTSNL